MSEPAPGNRDFSFAAALFTIFLCVLFGSNAVAIKITFSGLGVFTTAAFRFSLAALTIFLWARTTGRPLTLKKGQVGQMAILSMLFTIQLSFFYLGLSKSNASRATLLSNLLPFFVLVLAHHFIPEDRITRRKFFGMLIGFSGVVFVFLEKRGISTGFQNGDAMMLFAAFIWACSVVYIKKIISNYSPFHIVLYSMAFSIPVFFLQAFFWDDAMIVDLNLKVLGALLYQGVVTASFGFVAWNVMLQKYGAVSLHSFNFIMPIAGVLLGGLVLGEPITNKILWALVLIVAGLLTVHLKPKRPSTVYPIRRSI